MKTALKVTSVLSIIYAIHYIILGILNFFVAGLMSFVSLASMSMKAFAGTFGVIIAIAAEIFIAYSYGAAGVYARKDQKKKALIWTLVSAICGLVAFILSAASPLSGVTFSDVFGFILPLIHGFLIIQTA